MALKDYLPKSLKHQFRSIVSKSLGVPYNKHGVPNEIVRWLPLKSNINVVDIGASEGNFFLRLTQAYNVDKAILIEPLKKRIAELSEKFGHNPNIEILNCAVSDNKDKADFYVSDDFDYVSSLFMMEAEELNSMQLKTPEKVLIDTDTLDNITAGISDHLDLLKIDVQGAEHLVLNSGLKTLERTKVVYIEVSYKELYINSSTFFDIYKIFSDNNFRLVSLVDGFTAENGELLQSDATFVNNKYFF